MENNVHGNLYVESSPHLVSPTDTSVIMRDVLIAPVSSTHLDVYKRQIETHIFDFDKDIYGREIKVEFIKLIRPEMKFPNVDALAAQIDKDCRTAREYHEEGEE